MRLYAVKSLDAGKLKAIVPNYFHLWYFVQS